MRKTILNTKEYGNVNESTFNKNIRSMIRMFCKLHLRKKQGKFLKDTYEGVDLFREDAAWRSATLLK